MQKTGFDTIERTAQAITQRLRWVDFVLAIGALSQAVSVKARRRFYKRRRPPMQLL